MKNLFKSFILLILLSLGVQAQPYSLFQGFITNTAGLNGVTTASGSVPSLSINGGAPIKWSSLTPAGASVWQGPFRLYSITFNNLGTASHTLGIFDSSETNLAYSVTSGTFAQYKTNISKTFTTPNGVSQTVTYSNVWYTDTATPSPIQIIRQKIGSATLTSGSSSTVTFTGGLAVYGGIVITNSVAPSGGSVSIGITAEYEPMIP